MNKKEYSKGDFDTVIYSRVTSSTRKAINKFIHNKQDIYYNESHFIRIAVLKLLKENKVKID